MQIISLFSGAGGMDLGFERAKYRLIWSNEYDKTIWDTHLKNFPDCELNKNSITEINASSIPDCDGIIGGPPCQSFSEAGAKRGTQDSRGQLFWDYIRILKSKKPRFFVAENVSGLLSARHKPDLDKFIQAFEESGYKLHYQLYNSYHYGVPQSRDRLIFVGIHKSIKKDFVPPSHLSPVHLREAIRDLPEPVGTKNGQHALNLEINSHEYMLGGFSSMYMSRNRVRSWDEPSFTILARARQIPIHPSASKMQWVEKDKFIFDTTTVARRLSVRECARIQTFPDSFNFDYNRIEVGYKMVGNAVPVKLAQVIANSIMKTIKS